MEYVNTVFLKFNFWRYVELVGSGQYSARGRRSSQVTEMDPCTSLIPQKLNAV